MKFFYCVGFPGVYPVGTAAIAVGKTRTEAFEELSNALENAPELDGVELDRWLKKQGENGAEDLIEISSYPQAVILLNGDY